MRDGARVLNRAQLTRRAHQQSSRRFLGPAITRRRSAPLRSCECHVPDHGSQNPSASVTPGEPQRVSGQLFSALFGSLLPGKNFLPSQGKTFLQQARGMPSLEEAEEKQKEEAS